MAVTGVEPEGGRPTDETKVEFVKRELWRELFESRMETLEAMREGFVTAKSGLMRADQEKLRRLSHRELRYVAQGEICPTPSMVLEICQFDALEAPGGEWRQRAAWMRECIAGFNQEQVRQFLKFTLNIVSAPLPHQRIKFRSLTRIWTQGYGSRDATEDDLPNSHTCFGQFDLPPYSSAEQLVDKVKRAIPYGYGHYGFE